MGVYFEAAGNTVPPRPVPVFSLPLSLTVRCDDTYVDTKSSGYQRRGAASRQAEPAQQADDVRRQQLLETVSYRSSVK